MSGATLSTIIKENNVVKSNTFSIVLGTLTICILSLAMPIMTLQVYDRILPNPDSTTLPILLTGVLVAIGLETTLRLIRSYVLCWNGVVFEYKMQTLLMSRYLNSDCTRMVQGHLGEQIQDMSGLGVAKDFHTGQVASVLTELAFLPLFFGLIIYISGWLVFVPLTIVCAYIFTKVYFHKQLEHATDIRDTADDKRYQFLIEVFRGIHTVKALSAERWFERRHEQLSEDSAVHTHHVAEKHAMISNIGSLLSSAMVMASVVVGAFLILDHSLTTGALIATTVLVGRIMAPIQRALSIWTKRIDYALLEESVMKVLTSPLYTPDTALNTHPAAGEFSIKNVAFYYGQDEKKPIFENVSLTLRPGDAISLSGGLGSGRTTLLRIMAGVYAPTTGSVEVDGHNVLDYEPRALMRHIALVENSSTIFRGTIRDNLTRFGLVSEDEVRSIGEWLGINSIIADLPAGLNTFLEGSDSDSLPPGLKQKIAIARALAPRPKIILFDNAEQDIDLKGYNDIYRLLGRIKGRATLVIMSNDMNFRALADTHYEITREGLRFLNALR